MSVNSFGLFSGEFLYPCHYRTQATGNILAVDRDIDRDLAKDQWLEFSSSFFYLNMLRDTVSLNNFLPNFSVWVDAIMLPGFQMYDDTGTVSTIFPVSVELGLKYVIVRNTVWNASLSAMGGLEFISDYNYMLNPVYGLYGNASVSAFENFIVGLSVGSPDFRALYSELGARYRIFAFDILGSFALDGNNKTFKAGFVYRLSPGFSVLCGGNYTLEYNGWNVTGGLEFSQFKLFEADSRAGLAVGYNLVAGPSFTLTLGMDFDKTQVKKPARE